ncbi:MAG TPA: hypothetical protein VEY10_10225 [Flavisolibacter sp.]|nr:hypothetical protein [Flavisolibacter sp.]
MHDNFEKEVQRKMEEMRLPPSAPVWGKIEMEIKEEKKRRRGIFWFLFAGLLLAGGGWLGYLSLVSDGKQANIEINVPAKKSNADQKTSASIQPDRQPRNSIEDVDLPVSIEGKQPLTKKPQSNSTNTIAEKEERFNKKTPETAQPGIIRTPTRKEQVVISSIEKNNKQGNHVSGDKPIDMATPANEITSKTKSTDGSSIVKEQTPVITDSAVKPITGKKQLQPAAIDSSLKKKVAAVKRWKKQISLNIGRSSYTSGLFANAAVRNDVLQSSSGVTPNFNSAAPAKVSRGFAFATGFHLSKQVSKKWEFLVGLQYSFYSTQTRVGDKKAADTTVRFNMDKVAVDEFYTNTSRNNYTSRFHVVEIPVSFSYKPVQKAPLHISVGISYGRLLSTNALTYSRTSNLYYENKENYNRDYVPLTASVQYRFGGKRGMAIQTGPVIQYNLLKLQKEDLSNIPHLFFAGLKTDIRF